MVYRNVMYSSYSSGVTQSGMFDLAKTERVKVLQQYCCNLVKKTYYSVAVGQNGD